MADLTAPPRLPGGAESRSAGFNTGLTGDDPGNAASLSSLNADADRFNSLVPRQFEQSSVLQTAVMPSADGMAATDYQRMLPGMSSPMQSADGSAADTYDQSLIMRLQGREI